METFLSDIPSLPATEESFSIPSNVVSQKIAEYPNINIEDVNLIWMGDSRTWGMMAQLKNEDTFICRGGMGLIWLKDEAIPRLANKIQDNSIIILNFGVNDLFRIDEYIEYYNKIPEMYPNNMIVFMSINPVDENRFDGIKNSRIENFNNTLKASLKNIVYIDTFNYMLENGFDAYDGIHYSPSTSQDIRNYVVSELEKMKIFH